MNDIATLPTSSSSIEEGNSEVIDPLQKRELSRLKKCEDIIGRNLKEFFEVGKALATIKNDRLYRQDYGTFEQYCEEKWDFGHKRAYQLISSSHVLEQMSTIVDIPLPRNEAQIRPLLKVPEEKITETWQDFIDEKGADAFSAKDIRNFINRQNGNYRAANRNGKNSNNRKNQSLALTFELSNLIKKLKQIAEPYKDNDDLNSIVEKLHECSERIQEKCLCP